MISGTASTKIVNRTIRALSLVRSVFSMASSLHYAFAPHESTGTGQQNNDCHQVNDDLIDGEPEQEVLFGFSIDQVIIYLVAVIILLTRPRGLMGRKGVMET